MATLREIRRRITSVRSTQQITKAMKMVAAAKLRRAQDNILAIRPYAYKMHDLIAHLTAVSADIRSIPLLESRPVEKVLLVVVTADRGLCGAFNSNILRTAVKRAAEYNSKELYIYPVGRKSNDFFRIRDYKIHNKKLNFFNHLNFEDALELSRNLISYYVHREFDRIEIIYNEFKSAVQQNVIVEQFLPFAPDQEMAEQKSHVDFIFEPDRMAILNEVIPKNLNVQIWRILLESNSAEQGARMTAMENATVSAEEMVGRLTLYYNRARQAAITREISEIVGGAEALKEG